MYKVSINNHKTDHKILLQIVCYNIEKTYKSILKIFDFKYTKILYNDEHYFKGDFTEMLKDIYSSVDTINNKEDEINNKEDEYYGGIKKNIIINYNKIKYLDDNTNKIKYFIPEKKDIINKLIENTIYDINDVEFIKFINIHKQNIFIENIDKSKFKNNNINTQNRLKNLFNGWILNDNVSAECCDKYPDSHIWLNFTIKTFNSIQIIKIYDKYYDLENMKKYLVYIIKFDNDGNYHQLNCFYNPIGTEYDNYNMDYVNRIYMFDYKTEPWLNEELFIRYITEYRRILYKNKFKICHNKIESIFC